MLPEVFFTGGVALIGVSSLESEELELLSVSESSVALLDSSVSWTESLSWPSASVISLLPPESSSSEPSPSEPSLSSWTLLSESASDLLPSWNVESPSLPPSPSEATGTQVWSPGSGY